MIIALQWLIFRRYTTAGTILWRYILLFRRNNLKLRMNPKWIYIILLSLLWSFGMLLGRYLASTVAERSSTLVLLACIKRNSPIGLLAVIIVPFFISAVICKYFNALWIYPVAFIKAIGFGFCGYAVCLSFGDAGWLIRQLLMFTDCVSVLLLLWFWVRCITKNKRTVKLDLVVSFPILVAVSCFDYMVISSYLASLIN